MIHIIPQVKYLDFKKVTEAERAEAKELFDSKDGRQLLETVLRGQQKQPKMSGASNVSQLSAEQKTEVRAAVQAASTQEEIDAIETQLATGTFAFTSVH